MSFPTGVPLTTHAVSGPAPSVTVYSTSFWRL